ncbi:MAG: hypothetical protein ABFD50_05200 [Smithella sp.]
MNKKLQLYMYGKGIRQWQVAENLGIAEETLSRWMRHELSDDKKAAILTAIEKLSKEVTEQ